MRSLQLDRRHVLNQLPRYLSPRRWRSSSSGMSSFAPKQQQRPRPGGRREVNILKRHGIAEGAVAHLSQRRRDTRWRREKGARKENGSKEADMMGTRGIFMTERKRDGPPQLLNQVYPLAPQQHICETCGPHIPRISPSPRCTANRPNPGPSMNFCR